MTLLAILTDPTGTVTVGIGATVLPLGSSFAPQIPQTLIPAQQMGKRGVAKIIEEAGQLSLEVRDAKNSEQLLGNPVLTTVQNFDLRAPLQALLKKVLATASHKKVIEGFLAQLAHAPPPRVATFETLLADVAGIAAPEHNLVALHHQLTKEPLALFHELGEYFLKTGQLKLTLTLQSATSLHVQFAGQDPFILSINQPDALRQLEKAPDNPHYLLRALQREIFGDEDVAFTATLKRLHVPTNPEIIIEELRGFLKNWENLPQKLQKVVTVEYLTSALNNPNTAEAG
jgi:hypothetical protein